MMNFKFWKPKHSVCTECGVHFEPVTGYEASWGHLCSTHRKPVMERDRRREAVMHWARCNWEKLEPMYQKEMVESNASLSQRSQEALRTMAGQQAAANRSTHFGQLG